MKLSSFISNLTFRFLTIGYAIFIAICFSADSTLNAKTQIDQTAFNLYRAGKVEEARANFQQQLVDSELSLERSRLWQALINIAWFHGEIGEYRKAIEHSNKSLEIATSLNSPFHLGRSLCWLGMNYANVGLYELALHFYFRAREIGAPDGNIEIVGAWGLAQQEIGAIYYRMGDVVQAKIYLEETFEYARRHNISPGISEGGAHLAEIAITEGELPKAASLAEEAIATAEACGCSPQNLSRARFMLAKAELYRAKIEPNRRTNVDELIQKSIKTAKKSGNIRWLAESYLLLSQFLPHEKYDERLSLINEALTLLLNAESEIIGSAKAQLGRLFLEDEQLQLAEFYLKQGFSINQALFRKVDNAYILADISDLHSLRGETRESWQKLFESTRDAAASGNLPLALQNQEYMAQELETAGYIRLAFQWAQSAVETIEKLMEKEISELRAANLRQRMGVLRERQVELASRLTAERSE